MRGIGHEPPLAVDDFLDPVHHRIKGLCEASEFIIRGIETEPCAKRRGFGNLLRRLAQNFNRGQGLPRQPITPPPSEQKNERRCAGQESG